MGRGEENLGGTQTPLNSYSQHQNHRGRVLFPESCKVCVCCAAKRGEIARLRAELARVCCERDSLAISVEQLRMEIFSGELRNLDMGQRQSGGYICGTGDRDSLAESIEDNNGQKMPSSSSSSSPVKEDEVDDDHNVVVDGESGDDGGEETEWGEEELSQHLIVEKVDDNIASTYSSSEMTRLSSSSSSSASSASSSPVLFTTANPTSAPKNNQSFHNNEDGGDMEGHYEGVQGPNDTALSSALVIQRAYRRYSMVKEFQRIKTERRLSRRIVTSSSSTAPPVNSCDICIEVHPEAHHSHHHHGHPAQILNVAELEGLEDGLESPVSISATENRLPQLSEETQINNRQSQQNQRQNSLPPQYQYLQTTSFRTGQSKSASQLPQYHPHANVTAYNIQTNNRYHLPHQNSDLSSSRPRGHYNNQHIPVSHSQTQLPSHHHQGHQQQQLHYNPNSAPGLLAMVRGSSSSESVSTTPLTNVSPNLSSGSSGKMSAEEGEILRKRLYRVGLNLFNKKPEVGVAYLVRKKFLEGSPPSVARFLVSRKGLSKQMIGEYLTNLQSPFSMACLEHFVNEIDISSLPIDLALRKFQSYYRIPGEAQKIERLMEAFSRRYGVCNPSVISQFRNGADTVFVLAFAIIMLNTDLHTPHIKADRRMKLDDFIKNLRGIDDNEDVDREILVGIYDRIKSTEFKTGSDHVTQVMKVQQTIVGKKPNLAVPHRRLVCYCRLYEVPDMNKKEKAGTHQREVFLFNDLLVLTKIFHKKRNSVTYSFRQSYPLAGLTLHLFSNAYYEYGLSLRKGDQVLLNLNARNEHDRAKFTEDLREAIAESDEMARIESLSKENRDSGVDVGKIKRFSNSLLDINDQCKPIRRGSCGSLDSGIVSFQSEENQLNANQNHTHSNQVQSHPTRVSASAVSQP